MSHDEQVYVCVFAVLNCGIETQILIYRFTTYRHRFARVAPAPRAKLKIRRIVDARRPSNIDNKIDVIISKAAYRVELRFDL